MPERSYNAEGYLVLSPLDKPAPTAEAGSSNHPDGKSDEHSPALDAEGSTVNQENHSHKVRAFVKLRIDPGLSFSEGLFGAEAGPSDYLARPQSNDSLSSSAPGDDISEEAYNIGSEYMGAKINLGTVKSRLRKLWQKSIDLVISIGAKSKDLDGLFRLIVAMLQIKEWGAITRANPGNSSIRQKAIFSNGQRLWTDLPFLAEVIRENWKPDHVNLNNRAFVLWTAKLSSVGICPIELLPCGLWLLSETLETERHLGSGCDSTKPDSVTLETLLDRCADWLQEESHRLVKLCANPSAHISHPLGPLAAYIGNPELSIDRWLFWRERIKELANNKAHGIRKAAERCDFWTSTAAQGAGLDICEDEESTEEKAPEGQFSEESPFLGEDLGALPKGVENMSLETGIEPSIGPNTEADIEPGSKRMKRSLEP